MLRKNVVLGKKRIFPYLSKRFLKIQKQRSMAKGGGKDIFARRPDVPGFMEIEQHQAMVPEGDLPPPPPEGISTHYDDANCARFIEQNKDFFSDPQTGESYDELEDYGAESTNTSLAPGAVSGESTPLSMDVVQRETLQPGKSFSVPPRGGFQEGRDSSLVYRDEMGVDRSVASGGPSLTTPEGHWTRQLGSTVESGPEDPPLASLTFGKNLELDVKKATEFDKPQPMHWLRGTRTPADSASSVTLPRHLNSLFHKIVGWSKDLEELDNSTGVIEQGQKAGSAPPEPKLQAQRTKEKMKYGALMESFDNDRFALEQKIEVVGEQFEKRFLKWNTLQLLREAPQGQMEEVRENKSSVILNPLPNGISIPKIGRDPCPGCGSTFQCEHEDEFGYCEPNSIESWIMAIQNRMAARAEYASRTAELKKHWDTHGKRVGEEYLDFMTQEEFDAIYKWEPSPLVCRRCKQVRNHGRQTTDSVLPAEDFSEELASIKEERCVIVLVIDLTDFPGSMVVDLPGILSMNNPVIIAANKLDCVTAARFNYEGKYEQLRKENLSRGRVCQWVKDIAMQFGLPGGRIKGVYPVSGRKRWHLEELAEAIEKESNLTLRRPGKPLNTYFVGVTNVGKSTLINSLASILSPDDAPRHPRAKKQYFLESDEKGVQHVRSRWYLPKNAGFDEAIPVKVVEDKKVARNKHKLLTTSTLPGTTVNTIGVCVSSSRHDAKQVFFYDTPGLYPHWVNSTILSVAQQQQCLQCELRNFDSYFARAGMTFFFGGLAAIDVIRAPEQGVLLTPYHNRNVRCMITTQDKADEVWAENIGTQLWPPGSMEQIGDKRLSVKKTYLFECYGKHLKNPKADIYFCGLGYCSFYSGKHYDVVLRVRTLPGVIHGVRESLRYKDMRIYRPWPTNKTKLRPYDVDVPTVVELTAGAFDPEGPAEVPLPSIPSSIEGLGKQMDEKEAEASVEPFEHVMSLLQQQGKVSGQ